MLVPKASSALSPSITAESALVTASRASLSTTTIAIAGGGGFVFLLLVVIIVLVVRRCRSGTGTESATPSRKHGVDDADYTNYSTAHTENTYTTSGTLNGGPLLADKRIPFGLLHFGQVISQGGFGEIVRGVYIDQDVAIKRLLTVRRNDKDNISKFFQEIKLTARLEHDCLVPLIGYAWSTPGNLCMVSKFMHGGDLRSLMAEYARNGRANGHDAVKLRVADQIACALQYLHGLDPPVIHRDLKSRNVLLSREGDAKLIDFGVSCARVDNTMTAGVGTSLWMAPEVMLGEQYSEKVDIFSFGVILSELDTHALPYEDTRDVASAQKLTDVKLTQLISQGKIYPRFTRLADSAVVALARDCLQLSPFMRPSALEVLDQIVRIRHRDQTRTRTRTRTHTRRSPPTSRTITHDSVLSHDSRATTRDGPGGR